MNRNPNIIAIIPMIMAMIDITSKLDLMFQPMNAAEIPKNSKLKPTIIETISDENIGNNMNINPKMIDRIPAVLFMPIYVTSISKLVNILF